MKIGVALPLIALAVSCQTNAIPVNHGVDAQDDDALLQYALQMSANAANADPYMPNQNEDELMALALALSLDDAPSAMPYVQEPQENDFGLSRALRARDERDRAYAERKKAREERQKMQQALGSSSKSAVKESKASSASSSATAFHPSTSSKVREPEERFVSAMQETEENTENVVVDDDDEAWKRADPRELRALAAMKRMEQLSNGQ